MACSMRRAGEVRHNSSMKRFFTSLKTERTARKICRTPKPVRADGFDEIERFYNLPRRRSTLGYLSAIPFEKAQQAWVIVHRTGTSPGYWQHARPILETGNASCRLRHTSRAAKRASALGAGEEGAAPTANAESF